MDAKGAGAADGGGVGQLSRYRPRRPQASPLYRLVQDHFRTLETVYDERFARAYGPWRAVVRDVADKFLACGRGACIGARCWATWRASPLGP